MGLQILGLAGMLLFPVLAMESVQLQKEGKSICGSDPAGANVGSRPFPLRQEAPTLFVNASLGSEYGQRSGRRGKGVSGSVAAGGSAAGVEAGAVGFHSGGRRLVGVGGTMGRTSPEVGLVNPQFPIRAGVGGKPPVVMQ